MTPIKKRKLEFLTLSLALGISAAVASLIFFAWLTNEVLAGETRHFDEVTRAAVHRLASPTMTAIMRGISFTGSSLFLTTATILMFIWFLTVSTETKLLLDSLRAIKDFVVWLKSRLSFQRVTGHSRLMPSGPLSIRLAAG